MKTHSKLSPAASCPEHFRTPLPAAGQKNPSFKQCLEPEHAPKTNILSVPDSVVREEMFSFLLPQEVVSAGASHTSMQKPSKERIARKIIRVPEDCTSLNSAVSEVSFFIGNQSPHSHPRIVVGPGKHVLKGGLLTVSNSGVHISGTKGHETDCQLVGRIRIEGGATDVVLESLSVSNPLGAGIWVTGKNTSVTLKSCKVSGCRGDGVYARQGSHCELIGCDVMQNKCSGVAAWDDMTAFTIFDTTVEKNNGDGVKAFPGAEVAMTKSRVRSNSGHGVLTSDEFSSIKIFSSSISNNAGGEMQGRVTVQPTTRPRAVTA